MYLGGNDLGQKFYWVPGYEYDPDRIDIIPGGGRGEWARERACRVAAIDPADGGTVAWTHEFDVASSSGAQTGGMTATGGGLVFAGAASGEVVGLNAETGDKVWEDDIGTVAESSPVVWDDPVEQRQYMAVSYDSGGARIKVYATEPGIEPLETPTPSPTPTPTASDPGTDDSSDDSSDDSKTPAPGTETSSGSGPGFGVLGGLSGLGVAGAARKWLGGPGDEDEDEDDES
jgi:hypothetical protein